MTRRQFTDTHCIEWHVYAGTTAPRLSGAAQPADSALSRPTRNWLAFDNPLERRRLTPIPQSWQSASEAELEQLLYRASIIFKRPAEPGGVA